MLQTGSTAMHVAVQMGHCDVCDVMRQHGADLEATTNVSKSASLNIRVAQRQPRLILAGLRTPALAELVPRSEMIEHQARVYSHAIHQCPFSIIRRDAGCRGRAMRSLGVFSQRTFSCGNPDTFRSLCALTYKLELNSQP